MNFLSLKHRKPLRDTLGFIEESHPLYHYLLAFVVGILSSFTTIGFIKFYEFLTRFVYHSSTSNFLKIAQSTSFWYFLVILTAGGLLIGLFIYYFIPYHGHGHGFPHLLYSYRHLEPIEVKEGLGATFATSLSLAAGASVGREMPAIFFSSAATTWLCQLLKIKGHTLRVLIAAAVGTSLATSLHSSFVGFFFIMEVISYSLTAIDLLPITLAIFTGVFIREFFPEVFPPALLEIHIPNSGLDFFNFVLLGIICGILGYAVTRSLFYTIKASSESHLPKWIWPMFGGLALSLISLYEPGALGLGFEEMGVMLQHQPTFWPIFLLAVFKYLAILFSLGFGFSGGVFTPSIFWGLCLGTLYVNVLSSIFPSWSLSHGMFALMGAAAFAGVVLGAPITMTFLAFEITRDLFLTINVFIVVFVAQIFIKAIKGKSFFQSQYLYLYDT